MIHFAYQALSHGGIGEIGDRVTTVKLVVSDILDPLQTLATATIEILRGAPRATAEWTIEPGAYRWVLQRTDDHLLIRILYFPEMFSKQSDERGAVVFASECRIVDFAGEVTSALRCILEEHGIEEYRVLSPHGGGFPLAKYEALGELRRSRRQKR